MKGGTAHLIFCESHLLCELSGFAHQVILFSTPEHEETCMVVLQVEESRS